MTDLLEKAFAEAARLSEQEQNALADWILRELASEKRWDEVLEGSADGLAGLGREALAEYREGATQALDPDAL